VFTLTRITFGKQTSRLITLNNVVRVRSGRHDLYRHKKYGTGIWSWRYNEKLGRWTAARNGLIHATFDDEIGAASYCAYITGDTQRPLSFPSSEATYREIVKRSVKIEDTYYYNMTRNSQLASFGKAIKLCRTQGSMSQGDLAKASKLSASYISYLERGERDPKLSTLTEIAAALDVPVLTLVFLAYDKDKLRELDSMLAEKLSRFALDTMREND
jgi:transcriptional regulator with XRE-family HTH domain